MPSVDGDTIRSLREARGWTRMELATRAGVGYWTVVKYEQGRSQKPEYNTLRRIADALVVTTDDLLTR